MKMKMNCEYFFHPVLNLYLNNFAIEPNDFNFKVKFLARRFSNVSLTDFGEIDKFCENSVKII